MLPKSLALRNSKKLVVAVGPTASGKTALAIHLAKKFNGEVVSADSRQVYRGLDLGTGKTPRDTDPLSSRARAKSRAWRSRPGLLRFARNDYQNYISRGVVHHLIDVASPKRQFTVARYQKLARRAIEDIVRHGKLPILCGGTGHYIDAVVYDQTFPSVKPNPALRKKLERWPVVKLYRYLKKLDPIRARSIDRHNPRRLIRALEIVLATKKPVPPLTSGSSRAIGGSVAISREIASSPASWQTPRNDFPYDVLWLGLNPPKQQLYQNIHERLLARMRQGMVAEVRRLKKQGVSSRRLESLGLEYRYVNRYLEGGLSKQKMLGKLEHAIRQYAKHQLTWFRRNPGIQWIRNGKDAERLTRVFLF